MRLLLLLLLLCVKSSVLFFFFFPSSPLIVQASMFASSSFLLLLFSFSWTAAAANLRTQQPFRLLLYPLPFPYFPCHVQKLYIGALYIHFIRYFFLTYDNGTGGGDCIHSFVRFTAAQLTGLLDRIHINHPDMCPELHTLSFGGGIMDPEDADIRFILAPSPNPRSISPKPMASRMKALLGF